MKKSEKSKKSIKKEFKDEDIEKEIASHLKFLGKTKNIVIKEEKSELEKEIDEEAEEELEENLRDLEFHQALKSSDLEEKTPVLERIAGSAPRPIFVGTIPQGTQTASEEERGNDSKYVASSAESNEPKYVEVPSAQIYKEIERINIEEAGRRHEDFSETNRGGFFIRPPEHRVEPVIDERPWQSERVDFERAGRRDEREERKYEKYKPKFPK